MAQRRRKRTTDEQADDVPLASAVPKDIKRTSKLRGSWLSLMPFRNEEKSQVRQTDQVWYHDDMDGSSLARATHASTSNRFGIPCCDINKPEKSKRNPMIPRVTHTHTHTPPRREARF